MKKRNLQPEDQKYIKENLRHLGGFLWKLRKERGLTQEAASNLADLDRKAFWRIESGRVDPKCSTLLQAMRGLELESSEFFRRFSSFLKDREMKIKKHLVGRYHSRDKSEWIEIWRGRKKK